MDWYRRYADRSSNRKLFRAGFLGTLVFDGLCDVSCEFDLGGQIPPEYQDAEWMAHRLQLNRAHENGLFADDVANGAELFRQGLKACLDPGCGLLAEAPVRGGKVLVIVGWEERQPKVPEKSTARVAKHRERQRLLFADSPSDVLMKRDETLVKPNGTRETDIERENENEIEKKPSRLPPGAIEQAFKTVPADRRSSPWRDLIQVLTDDYSRLRGEKYPFLRGRDNSAIAKLWRDYAPEVIRARWQKGLQSSDRWKRISNMGQLLSKWADLADTAPDRAGPAPPPEQKLLPRYTDEELENLYKPGGLAGGPKRSA